MSDRPWLIRYGLWALGAAVVAYAVWLPLWRQWQESRTRIDQLRAVWVRHGALTAPAERPDPHAVRDLEDQLQQRLRRLAVQAPSSDGVARLLDQVRRSAARTGVALAQVAVAEQRLDPPYVRSGVRLVGSGRAEAVAGFLEDLLNQSPAYGLRELRLETVGERSGIRVTALVEVLAREGGPGAPGAGDASLMDPSLRARVDATVLARLFGTTAVRGTGPAGAGPSTEPARAPAASPPGSYRSGLRLQGLIYDPGRPAALLAHGDTVVAVRPGDRVGDEEVVAIEPGGVWLRRGQAHSFLSLGDDRN